MNKIYLLLIAIFFSLSITKSEDKFDYKQSTIKFEHITLDTLDNLIAKNGKKAFLQNLDSNISKLTYLIKFSTQNIRDEKVAFQLIGLNKHFNLKIDSFLTFSEHLGMDKNIDRVYGKMLGNTNEGIEFIELAKKNNVDFNKVFVNDVYKSEVRNGFYIFCNYVDAMKESSLDTFYKASLIYPNIVRNEFYFALAEFDRNCGNETNNSKHYKDLLYNKMKNDMSLEKALTDTNSINTVNAAKYTLTDKYRFFAYSLYAKNFDIKNNQKEVIYFLSSQNKIDGGFKEYNIDIGKESKSEIEPTFYAFWALLELREQINALYPNK